MIQFEITVAGRTFTITDEDENYMIVMISLEGKPDKLALVRDIFGDGTLDDSETRVDDRYYNEEEGDKRLMELSEEMGLKIYQYSDGLKAKTLN
jgi:hypothetical protein